MWKLLLPASPLILLCLSRAPINERSDEAAGWGQLAAVYSGRGEFRRSIDAFRRAAEISTDGLNEAALDGVAYSMRRLGFMEEALVLYKEGSSMYPGSPVLYNNQGTLLLELGRTKEGVEALEKSLKADPDPGIQYKNLFYGCLRLGETEKAMRYGAAAVVRYPGDAGLQRAVRELKEKPRGSK